MFVAAERLTTMKQEFTIEDDEFGEKKIVELKSNGSELSVTEENKEEYVRLVVSYRLDNSIKKQIKSFLEGFYEFANSDLSRDPADFPLSIISPQLVQIFEPDQLERKYQLSIWKHC